MRFNPMPATLRTLRDHAQYMTPQEFASCARTFGADIEWALAVARQTYTVPRAGFVPIGQIASVLQAMKGWPAPRDENGGNK